MAIKRSKSSEAYFTRYKNSKLYEVNRKKKLERQLKLNPKNADQINKAIKNLTGYRRDTPKSPVWSSTLKNAAYLYKLFAGKFDKNINSMDKDIQAAALKTRKESIFANYKEPKMERRSMYSLASRAHDRAGRLTWEQ
jgi:UDP-N-acetylenolpyruvoylglucosamine reductase